MPSRWPVEVGYAGRCTVRRRGGQWPCQYFSEKVFERLALGPFAAFSPLPTACGGKGFWGIPLRHRLLPSVGRGRPRASGGSDLRRMPSCSRARLTFSYSSRKTASTLGESLTIFLYSALRILSRAFVFHVLAAIFFVGGVENLSRAVPGGPSAFGAHRRTGRGVAVLSFPPFHASWRLDRLFYRLRLRRCGHQRGLLRLDRRGRVRLCFFRDDFYIYLLGR